MTTLLLGMLLASNPMMTCEMMAKMPANQRMNACKTHMTLSCCNPPVPTIPDIRPAPPPPAFTAPNSESVRAVRTKPRRIK